MDPKIKAELAALTKAVEDLQEFIKLVDDEVFVTSMIKDAKLDPNIKRFSDRLIKILNSMSGQVSGYHRELAIGFKHIKKARNVFYNERGDIAVDYKGHSVGKAIQSKVSFADDPSDITDMLRVAANQLTGERLAAETPGAGDRRIIDITIKSPNNRWPMSTASWNHLVDKKKSNSLQLTDAWSVEKLLNETAQTIWDHVFAGYRPHRPLEKPNQKGWGYSQTKRAELTTLPSGANLSKKGERSSALVFSKNTGVNYLLIDLAVKARYDFPFEVSALAENGDTKIIKVVRTLTQWYLNDQDQFVRRSYYWHL